LIAYRGFAAIHQAATTTSKARMGNQAATGAMQKPDKKTGASAPVFAL
jgi:hypothetical protein